MRNVVLAGILAFQVGTAVGTAWAAEMRGVAEIDTLAWQEAQQEMAAGEVTAGPEEWDRLLAPAEPGVYDHPEADGVLPGTGSMAWRLTSSPLGSNSQVGRLGWQDQGVALKLRFRGNAGQQAATTGAVALDLHDQRLQVGDLGLRHGYGLLIGGPGRGRSLDSVSVFKLGPSRATASLGSPDGRTLRAAAGSFKMGRFRVLVMEGKVIDSKGRAGLDCLALGGSLSAASGALGFLIKRQGPESGGSMTGSLSVAGLSLGTEIAMWQTGIARPLTGAWLVHLGWTGHPTQTLEAVLAGSSAVRGNLLGQRPFILGSWSGYGWALRWVGRWGKAVTLRGLVTGNVFRQPDLPANPAQAQLGEIQVRYQAEAGRWLAVAMRSRRKLTSVRSEIYPWQAPVLELKEGKTLLACQGGWEKDSLAVSFVLRSLESWAEGGRGRRQMFNLNARRRFGEKWLLRGGWGVAWGAPEDLVSAISPLPGYVLPRHWGLWMEETLVGVAWSAKCWGLSVAYSRRHPDPAQDSVPWNQAWAEIRYRW